MQHGEEYLNQGEKHVQRSWGRKVFGVFEERHKEKCERKEGRAVVNVRWDKNMPKCHIME